MVDPPVHIPKEPTPGKSLQQGLWLLFPLGVASIGFLALTFPRLPFHLVAVGLTAAVVWTLPPLAYRFGVSRRAALVGAAFGSLAALVVIPFVAVVVGGISWAALVLALPGGLLTASGVGSLLETGDNPASGILARVSVFALGTGFVGSAFALVLGFELWNPLFVLWCPITVGVALLGLEAGWTGTHALLAWVAATAGTLGNVPPPPFVGGPVETLSLQVTYLLTGLLFTVAFADLYFRLDPYAAKRFVSRLTPSAD